MPKIKKETEVKYPHLEAVWYIKQSTLSLGAIRDPLTVEIASRLLGWEEEVEGGEKFKNDYLLLNRYKKKVRCTNNVKNRPLYQSVYESYVQEILRKRWRINGETIIVGKSGSVLNGQHQLVAVILAEQDRLRNIRFWEGNWPEPVYIEKLVVFGVDETDEVINTMDTCKPRSLADVIYRSPYFAKSTQPERALASKILDHAVKQMWVRTGIYLTTNSFALRRTHSEAIDFIERHKSLLQCVSHIIKSNKRPKTETEDEETGVIGDYLPLGYAVSALYLMGSSTTASDDYYGPEEPLEKRVDWKNWDKACEFWTAFKTDGFDNVRKAIASLEDVESGVGERLREKDYIVVKAWQAFLEGGPIEKKDIKIRYTQPDDKGHRHLIEPPDFGGIDIGIAKIKPEARPSTNGKPEPTPDELEAAKAEIVNERFKGEES